MKILIVTQWFDPEPTFKGLLFAKKLVEYGHQVEVITGFPNYPGGKVYDGYKIKAYQKELIDGVVVHRVPLYPSHDGSAFKRILNYVSFAASSLLCGLFKVIKPDVIYSYHPPLTTSLSALFIGMFRRVPFIADIQDLWPDTLAATGMLTNPKALSIVEKVCQFVYHRAAKIVVLSPGFKARLVAKGIADSKIELIYNWCDESALMNSRSTQLSLPTNDKLNIVFAGNLGFAQGLPAIVEAAHLLSQRNVSANLVLIGDGVAKAAAQQQVAELQLDNIYFLPRVPMQEVGTLLKAADALLVHLTDDELFSITIPSRTQAYLAVGKPIVMGVDGDAAQLIKAAQAGVSCKANSAEALANAVEQLVTFNADERQQMAKNAHDFYHKHLSLAHGVKKFVAVFEEVK
ncbi:glycosyltransferase family 4 protein [Shewanella xiamenensis]|uniref:glycosyltransferase family 4 protein n=1 Tax=Shewanella xiamenensis TaxID=332186 RepID=UPI0024A6E9F3|nr:glycosyltransferase family 4 protein [Shewanella xiamenensis]MDI5836511.1 glycosyltransferase family 4 protein [Shewanella xiamenensis]MDI5840758.1 glycosyltransferase family 4 protein [Shewanella xiamenensis]MDI5844751.1 glycosyltransferase family 4 protein [Shewanella xiamenensis]MDI5848716.1 glycosyltransferase family 4 protein [Shewanella xiamenensis]MDI5852604.1 glycosyltransferase family 4 protein [Shewanella xiamenensis]